MSTKAQAQRLIKSERELGTPQTLAVSPFTDDNRVHLYDGHQRTSAWLTVKDPSFEVWALQSNRGSRALGWWRSGYATASTMPTVTKTPAVTFTATYAPIITPTVTRTPTPSLICVPALSVVVCNRMP